MKPHLYVQNRGDYAIYAIKYVELDMANMGFGSLSDETIDLFRRKMAVDIFFNDWEP